MSTTEGTGFLNKRGLIWTLLASWLIPGMMLIAYGFMALTAESGAPEDSPRHKTQAAMALGFVFVIVVWWIFRVTTKSAALSRAVSVGDSARIFEMVPAATRTAQGRAYRAFAHEMRGAWDDAIAEADSVRTAGRAPPALVAASAAVRVGAYVESQRAADARRVYDAELARLLEGVAPPELVRHARLAHGRVTWAEGDHDAARGSFERLLRDVRAGSAQRALAHIYTARIERVRGNTAAVTKHLSQAAVLAPGSWLAEPTAAG